VVAWKCAKLRRDIANAAKGSDRSEISQAKLGMFDVDHDRYLSIFILLAGVHALSDIRGDVDQVILNLQRR
jgi:hypothetical protein